MLNTGGSDGPYIDEIQVCVCTLQMSAYQKGNASRYVLGQIIFSFTNCVSSHVPGRAERRTVFG